MIGICGFPIGPPPRRVDSSQMHLPVYAFAGTAKFRLEQMIETVQPHVNIKGESYRLRERKEFMHQKQMIVNTLFQQGNA